MAINMWTAACVLENVGIWSTERAGEDWKGISCPNRDCRGGLGMEGDRPRWPPVREPPLTLPLKNPLVLTFVPWIWSLVIVDSAGAS